jgi:hypothetical protein
VKKALSGVLAWALLLAIGAGCGGDDTISKAEFVKRANEICAEGNKELDAASKEVFGGGKQPSQAEQEKFVTETVIPNVQEQIDGVRDLPDPDEQSAKAGVIVDEAQSALDTVKENPALLTEAEPGDPFGAANRLARSYGMNECGG